MSKSYFNVGREEKEKEKKGGPKRRKREGKKGSKKRTEVKKIEKNESPPGPNFSGVGNLPC